MDERMTEEQRYDFVNAILEQRRDNPRDDDPDYVPIEVATQRIVEEWEAELPSLPERGDDVSRWLKVWRQQFSYDSNAWHAVNAVLNDYRLHADTGKPLHMHVTEGHETE
jgi:hypothetical protein